MFELGSINVSVLRITHVKHLCWKQKCELRSRRGERMENGVKNLNESEAIPEYFLIIIHTKWERSI